MLSQWNRLVMPARFGTVAVSIALAALSRTAVGQEMKPGKSGETMMHPMAVKAMDMEKAKSMASPAMMEQAGKSMMQSAAMPATMQQEMAMQSTMQKPETKQMVMDHAKGITNMNAPVVNEEDIKNAIRKVFGDPQQFQQLLQSLIARETAAMLASQGVSTPTMAATKEQMMQAKSMVMENKTEMTQRIAKEMMIQAMATNPKIMEAAKQQAKMSMMPAVESMMNSDKMMSAKGEMRTPKMQTMMLGETMIRQMAEPKMEPGMQPSTNASMKPSK
jgi:actin-related protein